MKDVKEDSPNVVEGTHIESDNEDRGYDIGAVHDPSTPIYAASFVHEETDSSPGSVKSAKRAKLLEFELFNENYQSPYSEVSTHDENEQNGIEDLKNCRVVSARLSQNIFDDDEDDERDNNKLNEDFEGFDREDQPESQVEGIIADIFGESDAEEEFEGFAENELDKGVEEDDHPIQGTIESKLQVASDSDEDDDFVDNEFVSDFDRIMERRKQENRRKRSRNKDVEFLNDGDDLINEMMTSMRNAADEDRQLLAADQPATKKLTMLKDVVALLKRADIKGALVDNGMFSVITEWLSPLPGHTLPNLVIRDSLLNCLTEFQSLSSEVLQESGIGKALMYLYKHPRETRENKDKAGRLISNTILFFFCKILFLVV